MQEAVLAGVVKEIKISTPRNPNKWGKTLAPWFTEDCRAAKREMQQARKVYGKGIIHSTTATK